MTLIVRFGHQGISRAPRAEERAVHVKVRKQTGTQLHRHERARHHLQ